MALTQPDGVIAAYDATGPAWEAGPARIYDRLAEAVVAASPVPWSGRLVADVGAGTGAASRAVAAAGATPVAVDAAQGMLAVARRRRPPAAQADAVALPFADGVLGGVVAAFAYNHLNEPAAGLREAARVVAPGSPVVASSYAEDDTHPVRDAVEEALAEVGWRPASWVASLRTHAVSKLATSQRCSDAAERAGLRAEVIAMRVGFDELVGEELVAWRLGMAQHAPFMAGLDPARAERVRRRALALLGDAPPLERSILIIAAVA